MTDPKATPPPLPKMSPKIGMSRKAIILLVLAILFALAWPAMVACNVVRLFSTPADSMAPTVRRGDYVVMRGYLFGRAPHRGDIVVFKTDNLTRRELFNVPAGQFFLKRVAGEPGDRLRIEAGELFINDKPVALSNAFGKISYLPGPMTSGSNVTLPPDSYFVLGDNVTNSLDSRYFGPVARKDIVGRIASCYWPRDRAGAVK